MLCAPVIETGNGTGMFSKLGLNCTDNIGNAVWSEEYHPAYDTDNKVCYGYVGVPDVVPCSPKNKVKSKLQRICNCINKSKCAVERFMLVFV